DASKISRMFDRYRFAEGSFAGLRGARVLAVFAMKNARAGLSTRRLDHSRDSVPKLPSGASMGHHRARRHRQNLRLPAPSQIVDLARAPPHREIWIERQRSHTCPAKIHIPSGQLESRKKMIGFAQKKIDVFIGSVDIACVVIKRRLGWTEIKPVFLKRQAIDRHVLPVQGRQTETPVAVGQPYDDMRALGPANQ